MILQFYDSKRSEIFSINLLPWITATIRISLPSILINKPITVNESLPDFGYPKLRNNPANSWIRSKASGNIKDFCYNRLRINAGVLCNIVCDWLQIFYCFRRPVYFVCHWPNFSSTSSWLRVPSTSARPIPRRIFSTTYKWYWMSS